MSSERSEANARLIAAAPELLQELKKMVMHLGLHSTLSKEACKAIAKAEGEK